MVAPLATGIAGVIGKPGHGKSYCMAAMMVYQVVTQRRPVYTNLPIEWDAMRNHIRDQAYGSDDYRDALPKLIRKMSKQHFERFMLRLQAVCRRSEEIKDDLNLLVDPELNEALSRVDDQTELDGEIDAAAWRQACDEQTVSAGPVIYYGPGANWVPPGTVFVLDELHKWFNSRGYRNEDQAVQDFTSMHRHLQARIFIITQRWLNVSLSFRSMTDDLVLLKNFGRVNFGPIKPADWGWNIFRARWVRADDYDESLEAIKPGRHAFATDWYVPNIMARHREIFDIYRSTSHAGGIEEQHEELKRVRTEMVGTDAIETDYEEVEYEMKRAKTAWFLPMVMGFCMGLLVTFVMTPDVEDAVDRMAEKQYEIQQTSIATIQAADHDEDEEATEPELDPWMRHKVTGVTASGAFIENTFYALGDTYDVLQLLRLNATTGKTYWHHADGRVVIWAVGDVGRWGVPERPAPTPDVESPGAAAPEATASAGPAADRRLRPGEAPDGNL
ncbi:MAG: zonular occludens toxin domain-containing protein [Planctomycetota bacterium]